MAGEYSVFKFPQPVREMRISPDQLHEEHQPCFY